MSLADLRGVVDGHNVRMLQACSRLDFAEETALVGWIAQEFLPRDLERDHAIEQAVTGFEHLAHAALSKSGEQLIRAKNEAFALLRQETFALKFREPAAAHTFTRKLLGGRVLLTQRSGGFFQLLGKKKIQIAKLVE